MSDGRLFLGTRRYSSWSLRGWLAVRLAGLDVEEVLIPLTGGDTPAVVAATPAGLVPYLEHRGAKVWESLAIAEYCAEQRAEQGGPHLWPAERVARARARSVAAEMHAGFRGLRTAMPMNLGRDLAGRGRTAHALADIARIEALWRECLDASAGPYLFGADFTLADAMFAPVAARLLTYRPDLAPASHAYVAAIRAHPLVARWYDEAAAEPAEWRQAKYEDPA